MLIIAEIGQNHNGVMGLALEMIHAAKEHGADIAKFQLYDVDRIFPKTFEWYAEGKQAQLTRDQVARLAEECDRVGIEFSASVFDLERFAWCEELGMRRYKVASRSIRDRELISAIARTGKPMIASLGMWGEERFPDIVSRGVVEYLYCVAKYPTRWEELHFDEIDFSRYAGFSDHTLGVEAALVAAASGARILEKHFTLDKEMHGPDHACSMEPHELAEIAKYARRFEQLLTARRTAEVMA